MKLNNKGFAISSIMYIILILAVILISVTLAILSSRKLILDKIKKETADNIYGISYNSVINTLKHEAISYASSNNIEQENIKIGDFETSVSQELLEHHELLDKYLTLYKNNYSYDVYLGQTKKITDISKPIDNMLGIVDYKIEGNSYQATRSGKNLFDLNNFIDTYENIVTNNDYKPSMTEFNGENVLKVYGASISTDKQVEYMKGIFKENTQYTFSLDMYDIPSETEGLSGLIMYVYYTDGNFQSIFPVIRDAFNEWKHYNFVSLNNKTISYIKYTYYSSGGISYIKNFQIEEGTSATEYEEYGVSPSPEYPSEIKSVGDKTNNLFNKSTITDNKKLSLGNVYDSTQRYISNYIDCSNLDSVSINFAASFAWYDEEKNIVSYENKSSTIFRNYIKPDGARYLRLDFDKSAVSADEVMLVEGNYTSDTMPEYEPYGYRLPVKVSGKNLWNKNYAANENNWEILDNYYYVMPIKVGKGNVVTISYKKELTENELGFFTAVMTERSPAENVTTWLYNSHYSAHYTNRVVTLTATEENIYIRTSIPYKGGLSGSCFNFFKDYINETLQIEINEVETDYEPYIEPVTTDIYLDEPLRCINGECDELDYKTDKIARKINEVQMFSDNGWSEYSNVMVSNQKFGFAGKSLYNIKNNYFNTVDCLYFSNAAFHQIQINYNCLVGENNYNKAIEKLQNLEANNKYLKVYYPTASVRNQDVTLPQIQNDIGSSVIEVDTSIQPSSVEFTIIEKIRKL